VELPVLVLPLPSGFRASSGSPFNLIADGPTPDAAVDALRVQLAANLRGGQLRTVTVTDPDSVRAAARKLGENPLFEDWVRAVAEYRQQHNTVPDAE
jgi:hypothetical protein